MFITHCYIPTLFVQSVIIPLIKCKGGDLTDVNNYRADAISNAISKIFESILINKVTSVGACDKHQFGFKAGHSTGHCTNAVQKVEEYYTDHDSHVSACFIDFSKAFNKVDYWKLFNKLLADDFDSDIVAVLAV
jgi:Reverse transcriptase (RNA-dependent DNA polymerase)